MQRRIRGRWKALRASSPDTEQEHYGESWLSRQHQPGEQPYRDDSMSGHHAERCLGNQACYNRALKRATHRISLLSTLSGWIGARWNDDPAAADVVDRADLRTNKGVGELVLPPAPSLCLLRVRHGDADAANAGAARIDHDRVCALCRARVVSGSRPDLVRRSIRPWRDSSTTEARSAEYLDARTDRSSLDEPHA
jgi:hypothetical protein